MFFRIKNVPATDLTIVDIKMHARRFILLSKKQAADVELNKYLMENKKINLIAACLKIINNIQCNFNLNGDLIITILDKKLDELASLINYGSGKIHGSNILKRAFAQF